MSPGDSGEINVMSDDLNLAATTFTKQQDALDNAWLALALSLHADMAGNDGGAEKFASKYDSTARSVWKAFDAACRVVGGRHLRHRPGPSQGKRALQPPRLVGEVLAQQWPGRAACCGGRGAKPETKWAVSPQTLHNAVNSGTANNDTQGLQAMSEPGSTDSV
jgi:hypothetical protein